MFNVIIKNILCCFGQNKYNKNNRRLYNHNEYNNIDAKFNQQVNIILEANKKFNNNMELL
jgi:hypothetical protein